MDMVFVINEHTVGILACELPAVVRDQFIIAIFKSERIVSLNVFLTSALNGL